MKNEQTNSREGGSSLGFLLWLILATAVSYLATARLDHYLNLYITGGLLLVMFLTSKSPDSRIMRVTFITLSTFMVLRYFTWRTLYTLAFTDWPSFIFALTLYAAEVYAVSICLLGNFVNLSNYERKPVPLPAEKNLPTVDILVPSYNESPELLEATLMGVLEMRYPAQKLRVYLCDDGGTDQKCESDNEESANAAKERRLTLQKLCQDLGITYMTRARNEGAKAGNLNSAFHQSEGELVVIFDADHVPTNDFLEKTVGLFNQDPKLFLVQTPHFMINPDPVERNLDTFGRMPSEGEMFYRVIQKGLDFWGSAYFCGSGAVMRRSCLEVTGGLAGETITEDAETALTLHSKGFHSAYISTPMLSGLSPETVGTFVVQRSRWAQGMMQILLLKNPLLLRGLSLPQRLCYLNSCIFWFFPFARLVYMLAPVAFLVFGLKIYNANGPDFLLYGVSYLIAVLTTANYLYGRVRWSFVSELYELLQSVYILPAVVSVWLKPRAPTFKVTPKGETLDKDFISPLVLPFYILTVINVFCIGAGVYKLWHSDLSSDRYPVGITMFWSVFNLLILLCALGALMERKQRRATPRMPAQIPAELVIGDVVYPCRCVDISMGGCALVVRGVDQSEILRTDSAQVRFKAIKNQPEVTLNILLRSATTGEGHGELQVGAEFSHKTSEERRIKVRMAGGSSVRWASFQDRGGSKMGVLGSFTNLVGLGLKNTAAHISHMFR